MDNVARKRAQVHAGNCCPIRKRWSGKYFGWRAERLGFQAMRVCVVLINRVGNPCQVKACCDVWSFDVAEEGDVRSCRGSVFFIVRIISFAYCILNGADFFPDEFYETFDFIDT